MKNSFELTPEDYNNIAEAAITASNKDENELFTMLGNGLYDLGLESADKKSGPLLKSIGSAVGQISPMAAFEFVGRPEALSMETALIHGREVWHRLKEKVRDFICNSEFVKKFMEGDGTITLKDVLTKLVPIILTALGFSLLNPTVVGIIVTVLGALVKLGFDAYCAV